MLAWYSSSMVQDMLKFPAESWRECRKAAGVVAIHARDGVNMLLLPEHRSQRHNQSNYLLATTTKEHKT